MTHLTPVPWHLGSLHPVEQVLVALIAFGPFVVLGVVVYVVRRRDVAAEHAAEQAAEPVDRRGPDPGGSVPRG
jgi:hypothetical protein